MYKRQAQGGVSGGPGSVPPNPTTPVTTTPFTTGGGCTPGTFESCGCPNGYPGAQECGSDGAYLPCECEYDDSTTSGWESSGGWETSTGWWGSSSGSSGWNGNHIPELPPGETCLPLGLPCEGFFEFDSDEDLIEVSTCSRVLGDLFIEFDVTDLGTLGCLRHVDGVFVLAQTELVGVEDFGLETADVFAVAENPQLVLLDAPNLHAVGSLHIVNNDILETMVLPQLSEVGEFLEIFGNDLLPDCAVVELYQGVDPSTFVCDDNLPDKCTPTCG
ncbi:MAG: hypothetical protein KUG77_01430 [Nannocystaceae bacterium]|nr:hypothetical protein [Nannocystaceae bacterium]